MLTFEDVVFLGFISFAVYLANADFGIYFQKKYVFGDWYELMKAYNINNKYRIKYKNICFLHIEKCPKMLNEITCKLAVLDNDVYLKVLPDMPPLFSKRLRFQIPKKDLEFVQSEKLSRIFLFMAAVNVKENNYYRYRITNSGISILCRAGVLESDSKSEMGNYETNPNENINPELA